MSFLRCGSTARVDEHLDLVAGRRQQGHEALLDDVVDRDLRTHDLLDRIAARGDEPGDPREVGDRVAPGADERDVALREQHRLHRRPPGGAGGRRGAVGAGGVCRPVCATRPADRTDARAVCRARSLPEHSIAASTPIPAKRSLRWPATSVVLGSSTSATPRLRISAWRLGLGSETKTRAPSDTAYSAASAPIGPAPVTSTVSPGLT